MNSAEFQAKIKEDGAASFWLQRQIQTVSDRDVLDALIDAEALAVYCELRAVEAGINLKPRRAQNDSWAWCPRCDMFTSTIDEGSTCSQCKLVL